MGTLATNPFWTMYLCVAQEHRPEMLLLAFAVAVLGGSSGMLTLRHAASQAGTSRYLWGTMAGMALGSGAWTAHHIALLGYTIAVPVAFLFDLTLTSLGLIVCAAVCATFLMLRFPTRGALVTASLVFGGGLAVMHYVGMAALQVPATMRWDPGMVAASVLSAMALSYPALQLGLLGKGKRRAITAVLAFSLCITVTHLCGMAALQIIPERAVARGGLAISAGSLAAWIGIATMSLLATGLFVLLVNRRARAAVERSQRQFSILVKGTTDYAICMLDREGRISQWNAGVRRLTGYDAQDVIGMPLEQLYTPEDRAAGLPARSLALALSEGIHVQHGQCLRRDGSRFWAHGAIEKVSDEDGRHLGFALIVRDVTEFKDAKDRIEEASRRLDTALENMHEGLCLFDADERVSLCNRRFRELWNLEQADCAAGTPLGKLILAGFMNPDGAEGAASHLRDFRQILNQTLSEQHCAPVLAEFGENRVMSIANSALPDGGWVTTCTDITEQRRSEAKIEYMALHDTLTELPNRNRFYMRLDYKIETALRNDLQLAVVAIDLDRFKEINDTYGHAAGDHLLKIVAQRLAASRREGEAIARLGGDEFAVAKIFSDRAELEEFINRIRKAIVEPVDDDRQRLSVGASLGVALFPHDGTTREALLNNADLAMYRAKSRVGESICYFEPGMDESARARRQLASDLRLAVSRGELTVLYQPQRSLRTGALSGYEALLRWSHPKRGMVAPDEFIPIAEETGEICAIGEWVLRQACIEACNWPEELKIAVNVSPIQFLQQGIVDQVRTILLETGLSPRRLELEITETAIIADKLRTLHCLRQIKAMGVSVAIDDFGTGYSSLDTLHSFPFDKIKIDKSFLLRAEASVQARAIIRAVLALGRSLEIPVLAEGVENESQVGLLQSEGCDEAQGYYFGRPGRAPSLAAAQAAAR